ncbi:ATP-binding cassette domain-containing protein [Aquisalinus flavus]|uniref:ATP-binding protein Uup n=1 Tax=Aquisalinus flavus TaxID=1526572 RepID=A0A8J2V2V3_9PROT|nr:ATP-binding cassette domain-containing protein [Aquisalinus flavus]MBD0427936.1 ATP-binding cassette domain-containing protein [Aquisalinus flavus]UNE47693.1 ATP-binding cassette domain-containing protein [Aquisalinus flavus]GGD05115.1 elongation factor 3 [Aquisalinus flavus]
MTPPLLTLRDIALTFGGTPLLTGAELFVQDRDRLCLVGRNGSGKSTLLKIAAGLVEADSGERMIKPDVTVRYLEQEPDFSGHATIRDYVAAGLTLGDEEYRIDYMLTELGLTGAEHPAKLSGGEARRAALARVMAPEPDILLMDEPTNHLDLPVIDWLERELKSTRSAVVLISHDRRFLENITSRTIWLDRGKTRDLNQGFGAFEEWRDTVLEQEEMEQHKLDRKIVREEHWVTYGVTARRKRNVRRMKELGDLRAQRRETVKVQGGVKLAASESGQSGKLVIEAEHLAKSYGEREIVKDFSIRIQRGDRIGFAGPNGAGKTTLLKMLIGALEPDSGSIRIGTNLEIITLDQKRDSLKPETRLMDALTGGRGDMVSVGGQQRHVMSYLKDFLFQPEQARSQVSALSGGERGRLALAIALAQPSNLMVLDEPTNDLDLETLDLLQEMIAAYDGTVLLVSHDRDFLDRTVTATIAPEGDGTWRVWPGGYTDMMRQKREMPVREAPATDKTADKPKPDMASAAPQPHKKAKLSYKDQYALDTLPTELEKLQQEIAAYEKVLADANLFMKDPDKFKKATAALEAAQASLAEKEERWLELEMMRESLEG